MTATIGSLIVDIAGKELTPEDKNILEHPLVGGLIYFSRNFESRAQITALTRAIREVRKTPLLIMVDQEGGRVQRFREDFSPLPPVANYGLDYDRDPAAACKQAHVGGYLMASELAAAGIDLSLAPVLDLHKNNRSVIGDRAFHAHHAAVTELAWSFTQGMRKAGMAAVGKHFPGHGSVTLDSHLALPIDTRSMQEIERDDLLPFTNLMIRGLPAVMAAHIVFSQVDNLAVGFSRTWLHDILRERMGFKGVVLSDDLNMEGANISHHYDDRVKAAREAGCDVILLCNNRAGVVQAIDNLPHANYQLPESKWRMLKLNEKVKTTL